MPDKYTPSDYENIIAGIIADWEKLPLPPADKNKLHIKLLPFRKSGLNSLVNFIILSGEEPLLVIRMPRFKEGKLAADAIRDERVLLDRFQKDGILRENIPVVYFSRDWQETPVMAVKAYKGSMLNQLLDREEKEEAIIKLVDSGAQLLLDLHLRTKKGQKVIDDGFINDHVKMPLQMIEGYFPQLKEQINSAVSPLLQDEKIAGKEYPVVAEHREYNPWNLMRDENGRLIIFDWEDVRLEGLPLLDLFNYFTIAYRILFIGESSSSQARDFSVREKRAELLISLYRENVVKYCDKLGIERGLIDHFYLIFCLNTICFFIGEKRRELEYGKAWLAMLLNSPSPNCFENYVRKEVEFVRRRLSA